MEKDTATIEGRQPVIKTWQEFEERVLALNRMDWKADPQKFKDEMKAIRKAYYQGADNEAEKKIRQQQIMKLNLSAHPITFSFSEEYMKERLAKVKEVGSVENDQPKAAEKLPAVRKSWVTTDRVFNMLYNDPERGIVSFQLNSDHS